MGKEIRLGSRLYRENGKYYFYFPTDQDHIGVAVGNTPVGPFKDPLGKPLVSRNSPGIAAPRDFIDPAVFIDDDGTGYLLVGQNALNIIRLNDDMISYSSKPVVLDKVKDLPHFFEAIWIHKKIKNIICLIPMGSVSPTAWLIPSMVLMSTKAEFWTK